jgi:hypothetical protein
VSDTCLIVGEIEMALKFFNLGFQNNPLSGSVILFKDRHTDGRTDGQKDSDFNRNCSETRTNLKKRNSKLGKDYRDV